MLKKDPVDSIIFLLILCTLACSAILQPCAAGEVTIVDDSGTEVVLTPPPGRIVSLAPSATEILAAIGMADRIVGVTTACDYPIEVRDRHRVGGYGVPDIEAIMALQPDLIVTGHGVGPDTVARLRNLGFAIVVLDPADIDGILADIRVVGAATGQDETAEDLIDRLSARIEAVTASRRGADAARPTAAHVVWHDPLWVSGRNTFQDEVITLAGAKNVFSTIEKWGTVGIEEFVIADPDFILVSGGSGMDAADTDVIYEFFRSEPRMKKLRAVQNDCVIIVDPDTISRGGPRIVDALEYVDAALRAAESAEPQEARPAAALSAGIAAAGCAGAAFLAAYAGRRRRMR